MAISNQKLNFWAENNYNVIFSGRHGVGKTSIIEQTFNNVFGSQGKDWLSFSAATMDPWVDFIGVPKEHTDENGDTFLTLIRPEALAKDNIKALFFDEFNRSQKKVRNAVMELMQFKSINGHKFNNLRVIWAAINPPDEDDDGMVYDVEKIDPAQLDRFHIYVEIPYTLSKIFFVKKYGAEPGVAAYDWWNSLTSGLKDSISPRRLDYALDVWKKGGDIKDILPKNTPTTELMRQLNDGSYKKRIKDILRGTMTKDEMAKELSDEKLFNVLKEKLVSESNHTVEKILENLEDEKIMLVFSKTPPSKMKSLLDDMGKNDRLYSVLKESKGVNGITQLKKTHINKWMRKHYPEENKPRKKYNKDKSHDVFVDVLPNGDLDHEGVVRDFTWNPMATTPRRKDAYVILAEILSSSGYKYITNMSPQKKSSFVGKLFDLLQRSNAPTIDKFTETLDTYKLSNLIKILDGVDFSTKYHKNINKYIKHRVDTIKAEYEDRGNIVSELDDDEYTNEIYEYEDTLLKL